jgi:integrase
VCAHTVNRELGVFQQVLREFDEWKRLESRYRQVKEIPRRAGHSLTKEEEQRLREVAFSRPRWRLAANCITIMLSTTMNFGELRQLRRRDVDLKRRRITVREGVKNKSRQRTIPLNNVALDSMTWILERWKQCGGSDDEHYIFPHRPRGQSVPQWKTKTAWVLDQPTASIYSSFRNIRDAAGLPFLRVYDCHAIAQKQHLGEHSGDGRNQRGTGNVIGFPVQEVLHA